MPLVITISSVMVTLVLLVQVLLVYGPLNESGPLSIIFIHSSLDIYLLMKPRLHTIHNIINLEYTAYGLCGEIDGAHRDEQWLNDILLQNVSDGTLAHVDAG